MNTSVPQGEPGESPADVEALGLPLSFGQEQLWFLDQLAPGETTYNILLAWRLRGPLDAEVLRHSVSFVIGRHAALRTTIGSRDGQPFQRIAEPSDVDITLVDLTALPADGHDAAVDAEIAEQTRTAFDLEAGPLYRFRLLRLAGDHHVLLQAYHHIVTDGWSSGILNADLSAAYQAFLAGEQPTLPEPELTYAEFAGGQRERLQGDALNEELTFWADRLKDLPVLELPTDRPRPVSTSHHGGSVIRALPPHLLTAARQLSADNGTSLFVTLATAVNVVLSRYTGAEDIPVGVPLLGRPEPELEDIVGLFVNMVVLRCDLSGDPTFTELLERSADANLDLYEHQEVPFHQIVDRIQPERDPSRNPLFQVSIQLLGGATSGDNVHLPGISAEYVLLPSVRSRFDLTLNFVETATTLSASIEYSADLFDRWRIEALLDHVETVLAAVSEDPGLRLSEVPLLPAAEREEILAWGRGEVVPYAEGPLHEGVAAIARATPDAVAVLCNDVELTYAELDRRADRLARHLRALGLRAGQVVAVVIDRDLDAYVTMLGILKAGGAFAMLDPKNPVSRIEYMIRDTKAPVVVTRSEFAGQVPASDDWATVRIDTDWPAIEAIPADEPLAEWATRESLAYILYTSGSTGAPKGVMIAHRAVSYFAEAYRRSFGFGPHDRLLQLPALTFDMSQGEIWTAFLVGATVVAVSPEDAQSPDSLTSLMRNQRVTYAGLPPAMQSVLDADSYPDLRYVMGGAEKLPPELVNKWNLPGRTYLNLYGPTEAAIACTEYVCEHITWTTSPPIGRPHINRQVYIVDHHRNLLPKGIAGELLIGGEEGGLARGYLNQPELTAEKFVPDPLDPQRTVYRSGDLVQWNQAGQLEILGRIDNQVKLRGLRIELGEIEAALQAHPAVDRAVVLLRPDRQGEDRLVGYWTTPAGQASASPADLRTHLGTTLPDYMVPAAWVALQEFPLSGGWKINRKALPEPAEADDAGEEFVGPRTPTEEAVAKIFAEVLSVPRIGADESFFGIGGNSLQAMRVVGRINKTFKVKISIRLLYGNATVAAISAAVDEKLSSKPAVEA
ncbi:amino acid adenylation domain-containing protein [Dactylosporangium sp. NPDC051484]|uniref:non-ribosomal peptide synthetase n=1 Tax=Dactylosporangium sp. NPDC051484 TaxID=3154942 RepID=UPI00344FBAAB